MPRIALLSDVHGNLEALRAVLKHVARAVPDTVVHLGDAVGYGPDPGPCVEILSTLCDVLVLGNHDEAALTAATTEDNFSGTFAFGPAAAQSLRITQSLLTAEHRRAIHAWHQKATVGNLACTHASFGPARYEYLRDDNAARASLAGLEQPFGAVGHTHAQAVVMDSCDNEPMWLAVEPGEAVVIPGARTIVNPGSIGLPRDNNPDAGWAILDTDKRTFEPFRVRYSADITEEKTRMRGLPPMRRRQARAAYA